MGKNQSTNTQAPNEQTQYLFEQFHTNTQTTNQTEELDISNIPTPHQQALQTTNYQNMKTIWKNKSYTLTIPTQQPYLLKNFLTKQPTHLKKQTPGILPYLTF